MVVLMISHLGNCGWAGALTKMKASQRTGGNFGKQKSYCLTLRFDNTLLHVRVMKFLLP